MKRLNAVLNTVAVAFICAFIGYGIYVALDFKAHPELYNVQSAPWYMSILLYGICTVAVMLTCFWIKTIIKHKQKNNYLNCGEDDICKK